MRKRSKKNSRRRAKRATRTSWRRLRITENRRYALLSKQEVATLAQVSERTASEYLRDPSQIPEHRLEMLKLKALGRVDGLSEPVYVDQGELVLGNGYRFSVERLYSLTYALQELSTLRREVIEQKNTITRLQRFLDFWRVHAGGPVAVNDAEQ